MQKFLTFASKDLICTESIIPITLLFLVSIDISDGNLLGLLVIGLISGTTSMNVNWAGWLLFFGIVFFSGSLYFLALTQVRILGAITPIGGVLFIIGWLVLVIATLKFAG